MKHTTLWKYFFTIILLQAFIKPAISSAIDEVKAIDRDYIMIHFKDGDVRFVDDGVGAGAFTFIHNPSNNYVVNYGDPLNISNAVNPANWKVVSNDDPNFGSAGLAPIVCHRKSKVNGHAEFENVGSDYRYEYTMEHFIYLKLPQSMIQGKHYTIQINANTKADVLSHDLHFNIYENISESIHVNLVGYVNDGHIKSADLYAWLGDGGERNYSDFEGKKVWIYNVNNYNTQEVGTVKWWKAKKIEFFGHDFTKADVRTIDFTGFDTPGTYRLVVEGVGCSQDFEIKATVYQDPFQVTLKGFFYMRVGQDNLNMTPIPRRPLYIPGYSPADTRVIVTDMDPYHPDWNTFTNGVDPWDRAHLWEPYVKSGSPDNWLAKGGHADALDWDRHLGHVSIIYDLILPYIITNGAIDDDNVGIAESQNGIPDVLDEARNEVDFWLSLRYQGGYSHGLTNPEWTRNILYQADNTTIAAWANAANCAMLADAFRINGNTELMNYYRDEAITAYNYASAQPNKMYDTKVNVGQTEMRGRDFKMMAAGYLYNLTGNATYENVLAQESVVTNGSSLINVVENYNQLYGIASYLHSPQTIHNPTLYNNMKSSVVYSAKQKEANSSFERPTRRSTDIAYFHSTQMVMRSILGHAVADNASDKSYLLDALYLEADWGLGRNPLNIIQMTTATTSLSTKRSVEQIYTSGTDDGTPGVHPGHTPYMGVNNWGCDMTYSCPDKLWDRGYPDFSQWPRGESIVNTRYIFAHSEFTPQQTMRGKMALYAYLYALGKENVTPPPVGGSGSITYERYDNIEGISISDLSAAASYPNAPASSQELNSFEAPSDIKDNYGVRMSGYITAPSTGAYVFWIAADDNAELWLSNSANPANKTKIASHSSWTAKRQWDKFATQKSVGINLEQGKKYYIEALMKEGQGGDNLSVGWAKPGQTLEYPSEVIPGTALSPRIEAIYRTLTVANGTGGGSYEEGSNVNISANDAPSGKIFKEWVGDVANLSDVNASNTQVTIPSEDLIVTATYGNVDGGSCQASGSLLYERYNDITGSSIDNLKNATKYPEFPDVSQYLEVFDAPRNVASNYGARLSGYLCAPTTGNYTFWITGDDNVELWLSTDTNPANKIKIAYHTSYSSYKQWNKFTTQKSISISLQANNTYYIEALMKEGSGGDHVAVGWAKPGQSTSAPSEVIPADFMAPDLQQPYNNTIISIPGVVESENYNEGLNGVAYYDSSAGNTGGAYRTNDVDVAVCAEGGYNVGWIDTGEWLNYTVNVENAGIYNITLHVASANGGGEVQLSFSKGNVVTNSISTGGTGGWQVWQQVNVSGVNLSAGMQVMQLKVINGGFNVDKITFSNPNANRLSANVLESIAKNEIKIYPNPLVGNSLTLNDGNLASLKDIQIVNMLGMIMSVQVMTLQNDIIVKFNNKLAPGIYMVSYILDGEVKMDKLIVGRRMR